MKKILLIDPIHSSKFLSDSLAKNQIKTTALFSNLNDIAEYNRPSKELFDEQIYIDDIDSDLILKLSDTSFDFVINGTDQHLHITESIASKITPSLSNDVNYSHYRADKYYQQECMRKNGYNSIKQIRIDLDHFDDTILKNVKYPVFAKPVNGGGTIGAFKANNKEELIKNLSNAPKVINYEKIKKYLIQEYIDGIEIAVDTFSVNGIHSISHVTKYNKILYKDGPIYISAQIVVDSEMITKCSNFARNVLNACKYENGFAHIELFYLGNDDFYLIELNPRVSGGNGCLNIAAENSKLNTQIDLLVKYLADSKAIARDVSLGSGYSVTLFSYDHAYDYNYLYSLESYMMHTVITSLPFVDDRSPNMTDLRSIISLHNSDYKNLCRDIIKIQEIDSFYKINKLKVNEIRGIDDDL